MNRLMNRLMNLEMLYVNFVRNVVYICGILEMSQICGRLYCVTFSVFSIFLFTTLERFWFVVFVRINRRLVGFRISFISCCGFLPNLPKVEFLFFTRPWPWCNRLAEKFWIWNLRANSAWSWSDHLARSWLRHARGSVDYCYTFWLSDKKY